MHLDYTKVIILILWWRNFQLEYWRTFQLVSTAKQKAVIRRDFLIDNFKGAYGNNATATLLLDFARKHMPDTLAEIESGYNEVYEKRHKRIEERKAALLAKERQTKPEETAEAENTQPTAEVQPEEHTQTEEVAA